MAAIPHIGVLTTDGGAHPADMWAEASANEIANIVIIDDNSTSDAARAARKAKPRFALDLADALEVFHEKVQKGEKQALKLKGTDRLEDDHDYDPICEEAVKKVVEIASKTPFAEDFKKPEIQKRVHAILHADMHTVADIERSWHVDKNMHDPKAKKWYATKHGVTD